MVLRRNCRLPIFMYLTDYRERCLKDIITQLEPALFKKVTGLAMKDSSGWSAWTSSIMH